MKRPPSSLTAILVLFAVVATACGSVATTSGERSLESSAADASLAAPPAAAPAPGAAPATDPAPAGGHQYGATLEEWTETEQQQQEAAPTEDADSSPQRQSDYAEIAWDELIPIGASGAELIARFEDELAAVEPGTEEAEALYAEIQAEFNPEAVDPDLDGEKVRLAGFVAPLTYEDDIVTEFLLVPTYGACIHVPPPPPNQTVMVSVDKDNGLSLEDSWGAVWVEGTMIIESGTNDLGASSYRITDATSGAFNDF